MYNASPINTTIQKMAPQTLQNGLHVLELFGGIALGVLRSALAAGHQIRCYTYVDKDDISRRVAAAVLRKVLLQFPDHLSDAALQGFDDRLPQNIDQCSPTFLTNLVANYGPVDLLGACWECQSVSRAGYRQGVHDPRFRFFFNMVEIINFFQREQTSPLIYILESTYPGERCTTAVQNAQNLVQGFLGAPILLEAADMGSAAHRVRLYWQNFLTPELLQSSMPKMMVPTPTLRWIQGPHHVPTKLGHTNERPFAPSNIIGQTRICMPTVVSYSKSNAYRPKSDGESGEGEVFNLAREEWEEPDCREKEQMMGYMVDEKKCPEALKSERSMRLGRALDANVMLHLGAMMFAANA